jgi:hypothetical protein
MVTYIKKEVIKILKDNKKPMTCRQMYKVVLKRGKLKLRSSTPIASISSTIITNIKEKGDQSDFIKVGSGLYDLNKNKI